MNTRSIRHIVVVCLFVSFKLFGQSAGTGSGAFDLEKMMNASQGKSALEAAQRSEQVPSDNVIQAKYYRVGPGDVLSFLKLDASAIEEPIQVSPENMLFIPRVGALSVMGMTLEQVRDTIIKLQRQRTPNIAVFVGLRRARLVYVNVRGNVLSPGMVALPASLSVSTALKLAMQFKVAPTDVGMMRAAAQVMGQSDGHGDLATMRQRTSLFPPSVLRNIVVHHADKSSDICDLQRAEASASALDDPYLREGDEIVVPPETPATAMLSISGAVAQSQSTVYKKGDKISFLLKLGGRCTNLAGANRATLVRDGSKTELSIDDQLNLQGADMDAAPGDLIIVEQEVPAKAQKYGAVTLRGEVIRPGAVPIEQYTTRVKDVIEQAGGLTTDAYLPMALVLRKEASEAGLLQNDYVERLKKMQYSNLILEDTVRFAIDELARKPIVACDIAKALANPSGSDNVVLQDGDVIIIPRNPRSVFVYGQVRNGGYFAHVPGRTMEEYINQAGGMTSEADKGRERVIKGRNGVWLKANETTIEAGDKIYVPHPPDEPLGQVAQRNSANVSMVASIVGLVTSAIYVYLAITRK